MAVLFDLAKVRGAVDRDKINEQTMRMNDMNIQGAESAALRDDQLRSLAGQYFGGDKSTLAGIAGLNPEYAGKLRGMEQSQGKSDFERDQWEFDTMGKLLAGVSDQASYQGALAQAQQFGIDTSKAPPAYDPSVVARMQDHARMKASELVRGVGENGQPVWQTADSAIGQPAYVAPKQPKLQRVVDQTTGKPTFATPEQIMASNGNLQPLITGMKVSNDPDGGFTLTSGVMNGSEDGVSKSTNNKLEERMLNLQDQAVRLDDISASFKPEFQQFGTRIGMGWDSLRDKAGQLDAGSREQLKEFAVYRRRAFDNLNKILKEMSGAAINPEEAKRLNQALPNAGAGLFDGDSPTVFKAKLDDVVRDVRRALVRYQWIRKNGFDVDPKSPEADTLFREAVNERGAIIEQEVRASMPGASGDVIKQEIQFRLQQEFSI